MDKLVQATRKFKEILVPYWGQRAFGNLGHACLGIRLEDFEKGYEKHRAGDNAQWSVWYNKFNPGAHGMIDLFYDAKQDVFRSPAKRLEWFDDKIKEEETSDIEVASQFLEKQILLIKDERKHILRLGILMEKARGEPLEKVLTEFEARARVDSPFGITLEEVAHCRKIAPGIYESDESVLNYREFMSSMTASCLICEVGGVQDGKGNFIYGHRKT
ncbi:MAG: hypothetical protein AABY10_05015 [Nanoarchaeota archaeon]